MKQQILLFTILCTTLTGMAANHVLTKGRNAYRAADRIIKQQVEFKDPGSTGNDLIWDFSMLQPINEEYKINYFIPDSSRMDTLCGLEHRTRYYYCQKNDSLWATGFENSTTMMEYLKPELRLKFPFAYGDTLFSRFEGTGQYCHRIDLEVKGYTRIQADARGELKLPGNMSVKKALRVRTLRYYTQTGKDSIDMTLDTYSWYAEGVRYPVFESVKTNLIKHRLSGNGSNTNGQDTTIFATSFYYPPELQIAQVQTDPLPAESDDTAGAETVFTEATYMPNPVVSNLQIKYKLTRPARLWFAVYNNSGVPVRQTTPLQLAEGQQNTTIDMKALITGTYTLYIHVDDMVINKVVVKK